MNRIVRAVLPLLAVLSLTICTPASAGLVESAGKGAEASDLSGGTMAQGLAPEVMAAVAQYQHAGVHEIIIIGSIVVIVVVGIILLVHYHNRVEVHDDDDDGHRHRRRDHDHDHHHGPGSP